MPSHSSQLWEINTVVIKEKSRAKKYPSAGTDEEKVAVKGTSEMYHFLRWLEPYLQPRKTACVELCNSSHTPAIISLKPNALAYVASLCLYHVNILMLMFMLMSQVWTAGFRVFPGHSKITWMFCGLPLSNHFLYTYVITYIYRDLSSNAITFLPDRVFANLRNMRYL